MQTSPLYTPELAEEICRRLSMGESLNSICKTEGYPSEGTVRAWAVEDYAGFASKYARAREAQADVYFEQIKQIADETPAVREEIELARLKIDARKWTSARMAPRKYGEKVQQEITGANGTPLVPVLNVTIGERKEGE